MNILITGIRGFIGFNAIQQWIDRYPENKYIGIDGHTYADQFMESEKNYWLTTHKIPYYEVDLGDETNIDKVETLVQQYNIDAIVHFAAESHVDNSLKNPNIFFHSNILGTANILNIAKKFDLRIHVVSTDEVYGITRPEDNCYEDYRLQPSSPYSSSKTSADLISLSYFRSFGTRVTISRCSNNFGKWQMWEKLLPTVISRAFKNEYIPVYGNGLQRRHWISVDEHNDKIMWIIQNGEIGKVYNIAPPYENYLSNIDIIKFVLNHLKKPESLISHVTDRLGHDTSYYLYSTHCNSTKSYQDDLVKAIDWYVEKLRDRC